MTAQQFVSKWKQAELKERSAAQEHFIDLCHLLNEPTPAEADPKGDWYCFERGASKVGGGEGWADVWMRQHFGWEYKGKRKDLDAALSQWKASAAVRDLRGRDTLLAHTLSSDFAARQNVSRIDHKMSSPLRTSRRSPGFMAIPASKRSERSL